MNQQKSDLIISKLKKSLKKGIIPICFGIVILMLACKNNLEEVNIFSAEINLPEQSAKFLTVEYTDSAKLEMKFSTPVLNHYTKTDKPYFEFPEGIQVFFYDKEEKLQSTIVAKYAIFLEEEQLWEARDSVVAKNIQTGEQIETEVLYLDQTKQLVYSNVFTKITNEDGIYYGERGFEAAQDLSSYKLIGSSGTVRVKDEE